MPDHIYKPHRRSRVRHEFGHTPPTRGCLHFQNEGGQMKNSCATTGRRATCGHRRHGRRAQFSSWRSARRAWASYRKPVALLTPPCAGIHPRKPDTGDELTLAPTTNAAQRAALHRPPAEKRISRPAYDAAYREFMVAVVKAFSLPRRCWCVEYFGIKTPSVRLLEPLP